MFIDGLWLSGITLELNRSGLPIPDSDKQPPIRFELTRTQVNAVAALLGFGMRGGDFLMYQDEDLSKMILDDDNSVLKSDYMALSSGVKEARKTIRVFTPFVDMKGDQPEPESEYEGFIDDFDTSANTGENEQMDDN